MSIYFSYGLVVSRSFPKRQINLTQGEQAIIHPDDRIENGV